MCIRDSISREIEKIPGVLKIEWKDSELHVTAESDALGFIREKAKEWGGKLYSVLHVGRYVLVKIDFSEAFKY